MTAGARLKGQRILVTRPAHQAEPLCSLIEEAGGEAAKLPLIAIEASGEPEALRAALREAADFDGWIFTSANAVRHAAPYAPTHWPRVYAIGAATARALADAGHPADEAPEDGSSSRALLALASLQQVEGKRYLIITGEHGLDTLARTLAERGASVRSLPVYRRLPLAHDAVRLEAEIAMADAIVLTSGEALDHLWSLTPEALRPILLRCDVVVPSRRVLEKAQRYGFRSLLLPDEVSDAAILRCLEERHSPPDTPMNEATSAHRPTDGAAPWQADAPRRADHTAGTTAWTALAWLLVLALGAALAYSGWLLWQDRSRLAAQLATQQEALEHLARRAAELEAQAAQLGQRQSDLTRIAQRNGVELEALQGRIEDSSQIVGRINDELLGGRERLQLAAIEQLLLLAQDRLQLARDVAAAIQALEIADRRLAAFDQPRFFKVREAIAEERGALLGVPQPDITAAALSLSSLIDRAARLPLRIALRNVPSEDSATLQVEVAERSWAAAAWEAVRKALSGVFVIRREDNSRLLRLLPIEQQTAVIEVLLLRLEAARAALLMRDAETYQALLRSADAWLVEHFKPDDPGVLAATAELQRLATLQLDPALPELGSALQLLRAAVQTETP